MPLLALHIRVLLKEWNTSSSIQTLHHQSCHALGETSMWVMTIWLVVNVPNCVGDDFWFMITVGGDAKLAPHSFNVGDDDLQPTLIAVSWMDHYQVLACFGDSIIHLVQMQCTRSKFTRGQKRECQLLCYLSNAQPATHLFSKWST